jgi:hypothetical protein
MDFYQEIINNIIIKLYSSNCDRCDLTRIILDINIINNEYYGIKLCSSCITELFDLEEFDKYTRLTHFDYDQISNIYYCFCNRCGRLDNNLVLDPTESKYQKIIICKSCINQLFNCLTDYISFSFNNMNIKKIEYHSLT